MAANDNRTILNLDSSAITNFGGDVQNNDLRAKYFRLLDRWRKSESGRLPVFICLLLAEEFPRADSDHPRTVPNAGAGPAPGDAAKKVPAVK